YCCQKFSEKKLTVDHVIPLSKGGRHEWTNVVTACSECNNRKGDKTLERANLRLLTRPQKPSWLPNRDLEVEDNRLPQSWRPYLASR
ncbi:MAG: HNH endonuclease, partial [Bdellovibrionales bacterium]